MRQVKGDDDDRIEEFTDREFHYQINQAWPLPKRKAN